MTAVTITRAPLEIDDLLAVVDGAPVKLDEPTRARIAASRGVVDETLRSGESVYGLTTNVGHGKDTRLDEEQIRSGQQFLIMSHGGGLGRPLPTAVVRAALAVRLNGIARGGSGAAVAPDRAGNRIGRGVRHRADGLHGAGSDRRGPRRVLR